MHKIIRNYIDKQNDYGNKLRVWSLVVTIFGDAIEPRGGTIRLSALQELFDYLEIGNNALRTAMSRLASDGWLKRQRIGRASYYSPSKMASVENKNASQIIYQKQVKNWNGKWVFGFCNDTDGFSHHYKKQLHKRNFGFQSGKVAVAPLSDTVQNLDNLPYITFFRAGKLDRAGVDKFIRQIRFHHDLKPAYQEFYNAGEALISKNNLKKLSELDAIVLRVLLIHQWRRIVLKDVNWPDELREENWPGFKARNLIDKLYSSILPSSENWLNHIDSSANCKSQTPSLDFTQRFTR